MRDSGSANEARRRRILTAILVTSGGIKGAVAANMMSSEKNRTRNTIIGAGSGMIGGVLWDKLFEKMDDSFHDMLRRRGLSKQ